MAEFCRFYLKTETEFCLQNVVSLKASGRSVMSKNAITLMDYFLKQQ
jgi:hypothetical protein